MSGRAESYKPVHSLSCPMPTVADDHPGGYPPSPLFIRISPNGIRTGWGYFVMWGVVSLSRGVVLRVVGIVLDVPLLLVAF